MNSETTSQQYLPKRLPKVAVIAGVGSGLGAALARRFVAGGCRVGLLARSEEYLAALASEIGPGNALPVCCDLGDPTSVSQAFTRVRAELGPCDLLVGHASSGGGPGGSGILELDPAGFENAWRIGCLGLLLCAREAARDMLGRNPAHGTILFTGATSSVRGGAGIAFSSAKFALRGLAQSLARELWPQGIHVAHVVVDGVIDTPTVRADGVESDDPLLDTAAMAESYWQLALQSPCAWTLELDLRPNREKFFE
jgi:NAD(P)-dependent dehydrogenase (short-subunit alcohol dehydrogenase family)